MRTTVINNLGTDTGQVDAPRPGDKIVTLWFKVCCIPQEQTISLDFRSVRKKKKNYELRLSS